MLELALTRVRLLIAAIALMLAAAGLGCVVAVLTIGFIEGAAWLFAQGVGMAGAPFVLILLLPVAGGAISGLLTCRSSTGRALGPADVVRARLRGMSHLSPKDGLLGALSSFVCLAAGGSVGAYGPVVHMGSSLAANLLRRFGFSRAIETGLGCGCAAAISACFNAPLAGIVFAHEVVLRHYSLRMFAPVASASLAAAGVAQLLFGRDDFLAAADLEGMRVNTSDAGALLLLGIACGLLASMIVVCCMRINRAISGMKRKPWELGAAAGLLCALIALALDAPEILGGGKPLLDHLASGTLAGNAAILGIGKLLATIACIGMGLAGGLFSPALVIGGLFGFAFGELASWVAPGSQLAPPVIYALVGMFATASPVIGAPLAGILIAIEFSDSYDFALSAAFTIVVSSVISTRLAGGSYYARQLLAAGLDTRAGPEQVALAGICVGERMSELLSGDAALLAGAKRVEVGASLWQALELAESEPREVLAAVDENGELVGKLEIDRILAELAGLNRRFRSEEGEL